MKAFIKKHWLYIILLVLVASPFAWAAGVKMMDLTAQSEAITASDAIILNDDSDTTMSVDGTTKYATISQLQDFFEGAVNTWTNTNTFNGTLNLPAAVDFPVDSIDYTDWNFSLSKDVVVEDPVSGDVWPVFKNVLGTTMTIASIDCITDTGTVVLDIKECSSTSCASSASILSGTITCDSDGATGSISDGSIDDNDWVEVELGTTASSPTVLSISIGY